METPPCKSKINRIPKPSSAKICVKHSQKKHMTGMTKFYRFYDLEIQKLPMINEKAMQKPQQIYFKDLPDKEIIKEDVILFF